jgi:negative regulator of flagellin synthesis FlgM
MSGNIKGLTGTPVERRPVGSSSDRSVRDGGASHGASTAGASDTVLLTETAAKLRRLEEALADIPVINAEQVDAIRDAIAEGRYEIDPGRIAERLIQLENLIYGAKN